MSQERKSVLAKTSHWLERIFFPGYLVNRRVRVTLAGWFYLGLILVFGLAAINTGNNLLYLILAVMISLLLASFWLSEMVLTDFKISRQLPESVYAGEEFSIRYELFNQKQFFPLAGIEVLEKLEGKVVRAYFLTVPAGKAEQAYASLRLDQRGRVKFKELIISTRFPFGFFAKSKKVKLEGEVIVMPKPALSEIDLKSSGSQMGVIYAGKKGIGSELICFKPYVPGDPPHSIAWKASARSGQILVKENEQEVEQSLEIVLNVSLTRPRPDSPAREALIQKAFGLSRVYLEQGFRVRLRIEDRGIDFGMGLPHLKRIGVFLALFDDEKKPDLGERLSPTPLSSDQCVLENMRK